MWIFDWIAGLWVEVMGTAMRWHRQALAKADVAWLEVVR